MSRTHRDIDNNQDVLDSRDIIARIEELQSERDDLQSTLDEAAKERDDMPEEREGEAVSDDYHDAVCAVEDAQKALEEWDDDEEGRELKALTALQDEAEGYSPDWTYGSTLIRDSYFVEYCEELVKDIGDLPAKIPNYIEIDWKATAENIKADYTSVDFDGVEYWIR